MMKKRMVAILSFIIVTAIVSSVLFGTWLTAKATPVANEWGKEFNTPIAFNGFGNMKEQRWQNGWMGKNQRFEVSEEFKEKVINIIKNDKDVQNLLNEGYNITRIKPIIKATVEGDSTIIIKATGAIVTLNKDASRALVKVDVENAKVLEIIILTSTIIKKA